MPLQGAIEGRRCSVLWFGGRVTTNFGGSGRGAIAGCLAGCHCSVLRWGEGRVTANFGEWTWCHCRVALLGASVTCNCREPVALYTAMASRKNIQKNCLELLADVTLHKDWFWLSGVYAGIFFFGTRY